LKQNCVKKIGKLVPFGSHFPHIRRIFMNLNGHNPAKTGFTLIELLVVIAIIGLLASVVLVSLNNARLKSRDAKRLADINQIAKGFELFFSDFSSYPTNGQAAGYYPLNTTNAQYLVPRIFGSLPTAPTPPDGTCTASGQSSNEYNIMGTFSGVNTTRTYTITFCLGQATAGWSAGVHTLTPSGIQ
jgi:prepilin-type N-terminal cleavage/methylation domain-containing protein